MKIIITEHAKKRLTELRQDGVTFVDIQYAASQIPGRIPTATRFRGFMSVSNRVYDLDVKGVTAGRLVITIIGK